MVEQFLRETQETYAEALASPNEMTTAVQESMRELASKTETLNRSLEELDQRSSTDLSQQLTVLQVRSERARWLVLVMFGATLVVAGRARQCDHPPGDYRSAPADPPGAPGGDRREETRGGARPKPPTARRASFWPI